MLASVTKGQQDTALDHGGLLRPGQVCSARSRASSAGTCCEVTSVKPGNQQTLAQATASIRADPHPTAATAAQATVDADAKKNWRQQDRVPLGLRDGRLQRLQGPRHLDEHNDDAVDDHDRLVAADPLPEILEALGRLDELTRRLRRECPWDREQDERTIVPHTVEEAYELADAAQRGVTTPSSSTSSATCSSRCTSCRCCSRSAAPATWPRSPSTVAQKLIRRHPHVFGEVEAATAGEVLANWDEIKRTEPGREPGLFGEVPENLPAPLYARKVQRRAASSGFDFPGVEGPLQARP